MISEKLKVNSEKCIVILNAVKNLVNFKFQILNIKYKCLRGLRGEGICRH